MFENIDSLTKSSLFFILCLFKLSSLLFSTLCVLLITAFILQVDLGFVSRKVSFLLYSSDPNFQMEKVADKIPVASLRKSPFEIKVMMLGKHTIQQ